MFFLTGRPLTYLPTVYRFPTSTWSPWRYRFRALTARSGPRRVDQQFARAHGQSARAADSGVPSAPAGSSSIARHSNAAGVRDEAATRALIAQENRQYARRQLIWFRKEPNLQWFDGPGESPSTMAAVEHLLDERLSNL